MSDVPAAAPVPFIASGSRRDPEPSDSSMNTGRSAELPIWAGTARSTDSSSVLPTGQSVARGRPDDGRESAMRLLLAGVTRKARRVC